MKYLIIAFLSLILFCTSCKSGKEFYKNDGELKNISDNRLIKEIESNYSDCSTLFLKKFKAEFDLNGKSESFRGNLYLVKDSFIIVSVLKGIEAFRIKLSKDKVEILDRIKREYNTGDYNILWKKFMLDMDFNTVQSIILNELYSYPIDVISNSSLKKYKHGIGDQVYTFKSIKDGRYARISRRDQFDDLMMHEFSILPEVFKISRSYIKDFGSNSSVNILYTNFSQTSKGLFANEVLIEGKRGFDTFTLNLVFSDIEFDGVGSIGFKVSSKYKTGKF